MTPVYCTCLTADRPQQTARAIRSFLAQTYEDKWLLLLDTSRRWKSADGAANEKLSERVIHMKAEAKPGDTIGALRNLANSFTPEGSLLCHWDSDDWSAPERIAYQVWFLENCSADAVGYNAMCFWDSVSGEAWRYRHGGSHFALGTSLLYRRAAWASQPFPEKTDHPMGAGEDTAWCRQVRIQAIPELQTRHCVMIAELHTTNTAARRQFEKAMAQGSTDWIRTPDLDEFCRERMKL